MVLDDWTRRIAATLGCVALLAGSTASALLLLPHSWRDLDDANVRMHIFRFHVYDPDYIAAVVGFAATAITILAMFVVSFWMVWKLIKHWDTLRGGKSRSSE